MRRRLTPSEQRGLRRRHTAAITLVHAGELEGWEALLLVVVPPPALAEATQQIPRKERPARVAAAAEAA